MNHLAHFRLAMDRPALLVGTFLGDHVKGRLRGQYAAEVEFGIHIHRRIDAFSDRHPIVRRSFSRLGPAYRRYGPVLVDVFYDHLLAANWSRYHALSLASFDAWVWGVLEDWHDRMPRACAERASRMQAHGVLLSYRHRQTIEGVLQHISRRLTRVNPVASAYGSFVDSLQDLERDFDEFFPEVIGFVEREISTLEGNDRKMPSDGRY